MRWKIWFQVQSRRDISDIDGVNMNDSEKLFIFKLFPRYQIIIHYSLQFRMITLYNYNWSLLQNDVMCHSERREES